MAAQPSKLTPELQAAICDCIKLGMPYTETAASVGVNRRTIWAWRKAGRDCEDQVYISFLSAIKKAQADFIKENMEQIREARTASWQASAWLLERRRPDLFARRDENEVAKLQAKLDELTAIVGERAKAGKP